MEYVWNSSLQDKLFHPGSKGINTLYSGNGKLNVSPIFI